MRTYKILSACGTGVATSTVASETAKKKLAERGIDSVQLLECSVSEIVTKANSYQPDVIIHTAEIPLKELTAFKTFRAIEFLTGIGADDLADKIADHLKSLA